MAGLPLTARDAARIGQLLLADGCLEDGTRLLPEGFVEALFAPGVRSDQVGLLWWRIPEWQRFTLREDADERLAARGAPAGFVNALEGTAGRSFDSLSAALRPALGGDYAGLWLEHVLERGLGAGDVFEETRGPAAAYAAMGYLGQYIVVVPGQRVVAVRQIRSREGEGTHPADSGYRGFAGDVIALARALSAPQP